MAKAKNNKKLVLYSGGQEPTNRYLHESVVELMGDKKKRSMTYIPYTHEGAKVFYQRFCRRYKSFGVTDFHYLPVDQPLAPKEVKKALKSDAIYLAGGNTYYFLSHLRRSGMLKKLKEYASKGGVLAGLSAGAIMLTPNIELAGFPPYDHDENEVGIKNLRAMGLVGFEFLPHFVNSKRMNEAMQMYSLLSQYPIFCCHDGSGLVINGMEKRMFGEVTVFFKGHKLNLKKWA